MGTTAATSACSLLAAGELIADKLPSTPSRLDPGPLAGRLALGALSGSVLEAARNRSPVEGAVCGGAGALAGAWAGYTARKALVSSGRIPDMAVALLEDAVAIGVALWIVSRQ
jgi:uncharacterized membrane protein